MVKPARPAEDKARFGPGGGPTAVGGYSFQAAVTAITLAYLGRGAPLGWLDGLAEDIPYEVASETGGAGDDLRIHLATGQSVEVQVKKGLRSGASARATLVTLGRALLAGRADFALLVVCPRSSLSVAQTAAGDLIRLGEDPDASVGSLTGAFRSELGASSEEVRRICGRLRIVTVAAVDAAGADIAAARAELTHVCARQADVGAAWDALYRDAFSMMATRGRRRSSDVAKRLSISGIALSRSLSAGPAALVGRLCEWTLETHATFSILGVRDPLPLATAWRRLSLFVRADDTEKPDDIGAALEHYHEGTRGSYSKSDEDCDADSVGQFIRHAVVIAGPGMGKSTLLRRLARGYALDGRPVLRFSARDAASAMREGRAFETAAFELGLDGSGLPAEILRTAAIDDWVILCDGLDEAGPDQVRIAEKLAALKAGRPSCRIIVTSRPIGYQAAPLRSWRHYEIGALDVHGIGKDLFRLLDQLGMDRKDVTVDDEGMAQVLGGEATKSVIARSLLMLGIAAALISQGKQVGPTRTELFRAIFRLVQDEPPARAGPAPESQEVLNAVLNQLSVELLDAPLASADDLVRRVAESLSEALGETALKVTGRVRDSLRYWEDLGLIETLRHGPRPLLTTTHLMFAEYAAGRALASLPEPRRTAEVRARLGSSRWAEALVFAAAEGAADSVLAEYVRLGFEGGHGGARLITALEIIGLAEVPATPDICAQVIKAAGQSMASDDIFQACRVAVRTIAAGSRDPASVLGISSFLFNAGFAWSRLCAWCLTVSLAPENYDVDAALNALTEFLDETDTRSRLARGIVLDDPERELLRVLGEAVIARLLALRSVEEVDPVVQSLIERPGLNNMIFWQRISGPLAAQGSTVNPFRDFGQKGLNVDLVEFDDAMALAYRSICQALLTSAAPVQADRSQTRPYQLGAVYRICGWGKMSLSDVWVWGRGVDPRTTRAAFQGLIVAGGLDPEAVDREAREIIQVLEDRKFDAFTVIFSDMPHVDLLEPDWKMLDRTLLDLAGLRAALLSHPSELVVPLAANLLDGVLTEQERVDVCRQALASKARLQVWAGAALAEGLPKEIAVDLLGADLSTGGDGLTEKISILQRIVGRCDPALLAQLRPILMSDDPAEVEAAANLVATADLAAADVDLVRKAERYWRDWEQQQADKPHTPSPRPALLKILEDRGAVSFEDLLEGAVLRWGSSTTVGALIRLLKASANDRRAFAERCAKSQIESSVIDSVFTSDIQFDGEDLALMEPVYASNDSRVRLSAVALLKQAAYSPAQRRERLLTLRSDVEPVVRSRAARALERS